MAFSAPSLVKFSLFVAISASALLSSALARDFSILGYTPEHLTSTDNLLELFESWMSEHSKAYKSVEEKVRRFEVFRENLMHIDQRNNEIESYWLGLNEFADLTHEEFKGRYLGLAKPQFSRKREPSANFRYRDIKDLPESVDWRKKGAVTPVKNQGSCGNISLFFIFLDLKLKEAEIGTYRHNNLILSLQVAVGRFRQLQLLRGSTRSQQGI